MGREEELKNLADLLRGSGQVAIAAATGMGGIGKTQLAWQYAENQKNLYPGGIWWLRAAGFVQQVFSYGQRMGLPTPPEITQEAEQMGWFYEQWLQKFPVGERLLVVDNVQDYGKLKPLLPTDQRFRVLLTTWERITDEIVQRLDIETLKPLDAYELFYKQIHLRLGEKVDPRLEREQRQAEELCDWLGYLPLGIKVVAAFLAVEPDLSFARMQQHLETEKIKNESLSPVEAAFEISWEKFSPPERQLAGLLSIFATAPIPWSLVTQSLDRCEVKPVKLGLWQRIITKLQRLLTKPQPLQQWCLLLDSKQQEKARRRLVELNCLTRSGEEKYEVHSLLHKFYGEKLGTELADRAETLQRSFAETLTAVAKTIGKSLTQGDITRVTEILPHLEIVANNLTHLLEARSKITPSTRLSWVAQFQSRWQDAERWSKKSLEISETQLGADHLYTATSLNNLAELYKAMGRYSDAEPLSLRSLQISETLSGANHPLVATSLNNLAGIYLSAGNYSKAEPLYLRSLQIKEAQLGKENPSIAASLNNLAELYKSMGRYSEAEPLYLRSLQICTAKLGEDHPLTATSLNNLAGLSKLLGDYNKAESLYLQALQIREIHLGNNHPSTATSLNNLAELYYSMGRYSEAEPLYLQSLQIYKMQLETGHPLIARILNNLALLYYSMELYSEAEPLYLQSLHIKESQLGKDHPDIATSLSNLAGLYLSMECYSEAEPLLERSLHVCETRLGAEHPHTARSLNNLAELYQVMGRYSDAEPLYLRTLEIWTKSLGENHPDTQTAWRSFRRLLQQALAHGSADSLSPHPLTQQLLQELRE